MHDLDALPAEERRRILAERRRALAAEPADLVRETWPVVAFRVAGHRHAVPAAFVRQFLEARRLSPLSGAPPWMLGAIQARARVVPVLNLRLLLGHTASGIADATSVILLEEEDGDAFGVAVDELEGHLEIPRDALTETSDGGPVRWWGPERLGVLDVSRLGPPAAGAGDAGVARGP
jgi:purine-binding chemotaxis protein CheW